MLILGRHSTDERLKIMRIMAADPLMDFLEPAISKTRLTSPHIALNRVEGSRERYSFIHQHKNVHKMLANFVVLADLAQRHR